MTILSVYNIKGGVGKTAAAVNLSFLASAENKSTLLCDLDPQSSATYYFRVKPKMKTGLKPLVKGKKSLEKNIKGTDYHCLDLLPADFSLRNMDIMLDNVKGSKHRLKSVLKMFKDEYEYIFLDCPPNITLVSENIFYASDLILVPVIPTTLSYRTFEKLLEFFKKNKMSIKKIIPFFSMVEIRKNMHKNSMEALNREYPAFLNNKIPYSSIVEKMGIYREPLGSFSPRSVPAQQYEALWNEVKKLLKKKK
jgi:cellulose biosynthesis protein BcsQ